jgi:hypothetical protein
VEDQSLRIDQQIDAALMMLAADTLSTGLEEVRK